MVTAIVLARAGHDVLVLEEGHAKSNTKPFSLSEVLLDYRNSGLGTTLGLQPVNITEGQVLGGGTAVNTGYYSIPSSEKLEALRRRWNIQNFSEADLASSFAFLEAEWRPQKIGTVTHLRPAVWSSAAQQFGLQMETQRFLHHWDQNSQILIRRSAFDHWSTEIQKKGGEICSSTKVQKISSKASHWELEVRRSRSETITVNTLKCENLFLCAGPIETPALLRRSGLSRNIGNNLQFHLFQRLLAQFPWLLNEFQSPVFPWKFSDKDFNLGHSPSPPHLLTLNEPELKNEFVRNWRSWASFYVAMPSLRTAKVRNFGKGHAMTFYFSSKGEAQALARGLDKLHKFLLAAGATRVAGTSLGKSPVQSVHLFGSCPMGEDNLRCATNSYGEVFGQKNLRIHDASLMGSSLGTNPQAAVMAISHRNTSHFLDMR